MAKLSAPVGAGGANRRDDVRAIQELLNAHLSKVNSSAKLTVDGVAGPGTIAAIREFQHKVMGIAHPDGRVEAGKATLGALEREAEPVPTQAPAKVASPPPQKKKVTIYVGVDPTLDREQKQDLRAASQYVKEQLTGVFKDIADVDVQNVDDWGRMKSLKGDRYTKIVYGMGSRSTEEFKQAFTDHREAIKEFTAIELARRGSGQAGQAAGVAAGFSRKGRDFVTAAVAVAKIPYINLLKNRLLHETAHLLGLDHSDAGATDLMKTGIGDSEPLLPLPPGGAEKMRGILLQLSQPQP
jgi:peptidoglycan hydrolase-like protein with peptidoglycan-binding domain